MAQTIEKFPPKQTRETALNVVPIITPQERADGPHPTSQAIASANREIAPKVHTAESLVRTVQKTRELTGRVRDRSRQIANEHPLQLLTVIAGTAFMVGVVVRVWRSSRDE